MLNSVPASATRMRQPPENSPQGRACAALSKPSPCRIEAARAGAEAAPISSSRAWISASRRPSWQVSASASRAVRSTSAASTASSTVMSPPGGSCGTEPMRVRPVMLMLPPSASIMALDQAQQRRFARAVAADQADLPAVGNGRRGAIEQDALAVAKGKVVDVQHGAAAFSTRKARRSNRLAGPEPRVYKARPRAKAHAEEGFHGRRTHFLDHQAGRDPPEPDRQDQRPVRGEGPAHRRPEAASG